MNKYLKVWMSWWWCVLNGWDGGVWYFEKVVISFVGGEVKVMNFVYILFECQINCDWGCGKDCGLLDQVLYCMVVDMLFVEGFGLCFKFCVVDELDNFEQIVFDYIGVIQFFFCLIGFWMLWLICDDYDVVMLFVFDEDSGLFGIDEDSIILFDGMVNQFVVVWYDLIINIDWCVCVKNVGVICVVGGVIIMMKEYLGLLIGELVGRVVVCDCNVLMLVICKFQLWFDWCVYVLNFGDVFCVCSWKCGIELIVLCVGKIDYGIFMRGIIVIIVLEDVFGLLVVGMFVVQLLNWILFDCILWVIVICRFIEVLYCDFVVVLSDVDLV